MSADGLSIHEIKELINDGCGCCDDRHKGAAKDIYNLFLERGWRPPPRSRAAVPDFVISPEVEAKLHAAVSAFCAQVAS